MRRLLCRLGLRHYFCGVVSYALEQLPGHYVTFRKEVCAYCDRTREFMVSKGRR